ncbi:MAG TPA: ABC transporter permease subunit [Vicinamibacteria bacterium]|nr:ABC transporter permease subunit [Vicinamibacteria bacterium]
MSVRNISAIVEKEWRHYFGSPIAWVALFVWTVLFGFFYFAVFSSYLDYSMRSAQQAMEYGGAGTKMSLNEMLIRPVVQNMAVVGLFILPMLTMRLFAEEKRQGTMELLATSPLTDWEIILGKFTGALGLYAVMIAAGFLNVLLLWAYAPTPPEWKPILSGALALLLVGGSFIALGLFLSSVTKNQIIAGALGFCLALIFWILSWFDQPMGDATMKVVGYLGVTNHMEDMVKGVLDTKDIVFYLSFIVFGLFITQQTLESQRWRA